MLKKLRSLVLFVFILGCIEPYEFVVRDNEPTLVIEAFISDKAFNEALLYPSDGRWFTVKLTETGDVINTRPVPVTGATVELLDSEGSIWSYTESEPGLLELRHPDFRAKQGTAYKLRVLLKDESVFESEWEKLPSSTAGEMGDVGFYETEKQLYVMESGEWVLRTKKGIMANIAVPENNSGQVVHYRWTYSPMWIYRAPLTSVIDPGHICWATNEQYLKSYALQEDRAGGYKADLFFMQSVRNERIFEKFSVLVTQHVMDDRYYDFWKEMKERNEGSALSEIPPYNLQTNYFSTTDDKRVSGFFGVVSEQARRWYFSRNDLSYTVVNTLKADCLVVYGPGPPALECTDCRGYSFGDATTTKPSWWQD